MFLRRSFFDYAPLDRLICLQFVVAFLGSLQSWREAAAQVTKYISVVI